VEFVTSLVVVQLKKTLDVVQLAPKRQASESVQSSL